MSSSLVSISVAGIIVTELTPVSAGVGSGLEVDVHPVFVQHVLVGK